MTTHLREQFQAGTADFRPIPFWFWNNDLSETSILASLNDIVSKGIREVLIHPRTGMTVDYLSDLFWERICYAVKAAAARGIKVWLYDDFNWPSGSAGGHLLASHPEYLMRVLNVESVPALTQQEVSIPFPGQFLAAFLVEEACGTYSPLEGTVVQIDADGQNTDFLPAAAAFFQGQDPAAVALFGGQPANLYRQQFKAMPSTGRVLVFSVETNRTGWAHTTHRNTILMPGFIDKLNPDAVQQFIRMTHDAYYQRLADYFGTTIVGIFTDEPAAWAPPNHFDFFAPVRQSSLVWSHQLAERFQQQYGYSLLEHLPELVIDLPSTQKTRYDFWHLASELYRAAYFGPTARWCEQKGIAFTGHINYEESPGTLIRNETGIFNNLRDMQIPGYDFLTQRPGYDVPMMNFSAKLVTSIAHALGRERVMCEIFGASGWQTSLADCRKTLNWIMATGISLLSTHGHYLSIQGMRKRDYPPSHSKHEPWWRYYQQFSEYSNRIGLLTTYGAYQGDVALLYSFGNQWMRYSLDGWQTQEYWAEHQRFVELMMAFLRHQHDFDFVFDEQFQEGLLHIQDGQLIAPGATYRLLVIPPVEYLPIQVARGILDYVHSGGHVLLIGAWPADSQEQSNDPRMLELGNQLAQVATTQVVRVRSIEDWPGVVEQVKATLELIHPIPVRISSEQRQNVSIQHRRGTDYELIFFANVGEQTFEGTIELAKAGAWELWHPEAGVQQRLLRTPQGTASPLHLVLAAGEARCFVLPLTPQAGRAERDADVCRSDKGQCIADLSDQWSIKPISGNMYAPQTWEARLTGEDTAWIPFSPTRLYYPKPELSPELMVPGALCQFRTTFVWEGPDIPADLQLVLEDERDLRIWLNEQELVRSNQKAWLWDDSNVAYPLADTVRPGINHLQIEQRWPDYLGGFHPPYATLEPVVIHGTFRLVDSKLRSFSAEIRSGSWHEQGFPHYIGTMEYRCSLFLECAERHATLILEDVRETAEVWVNGIQAGTRPWAPFEFCLTDLLQTGENEICVLVSNTAANLLQPEDAQPCGLLGKALLYASTPTT